MTAAIAAWRLYPTQIESGLSLFTDRSIGEWLAEDFTLSSRLLLELIAELPEKSRFKEASERTFRLAERGDRLVLYPPHRVRADGIWELNELADDVVLVSEFVDWTHDRKIAARNAREMAVFRMEMRKPGMGYDVDLSGLTEPLHAVLEGRAAAARQENTQGAKGVIRKSLFAHERG